uniref:Acylphosphatase-like domain-containing protein n=1 Tax=Strigamia maritima TaxID=126957 RepID=T1IQP1_STRMM
MRGLTLLEIPGIGANVLAEFQRNGITKCTYDEQIFQNFVRLHGNRYRFRRYLYVNGVFFPKFCSDQAKTLGLKGWVRNTRKGTILGVMQGQKERVDDMAMWLRLQGSPGCRIQDCVFRNWTIIDGHDFKDFRVLY